MAAINNQTTQETFDAQFEMMQEQLDELSAQVAEQEAYLETLGMEEETATSTEATFSFKFDGGAFVDSLGIMFQGWGGIFVVIAIIMAVVMILNRATNKKEESKDPGAGASPAEARGIPRASARFMERGAPVCRLRSPGRPTGIPPCWRPSRSGSTARSSPRAPRFRARPRSAPDRRRSRSARNRRA